jgi:hypothetical protein
MNKIFLTVLLLCGCSSVNQISTSNHIVQENAIEILNTKDISIAHKHAGIILNETKDIASAISGVKDITPWWANLIQYGFIAIIFIGIVIILWQTGIGQVIRVAIGWIPSNKKKEAALAQSVLDESKPEGVREWIAAKRLSDPEFDAAWRKEQNARTKKN